MRVTLLGYGTRGDLAPLAYLGGELVRRGHDVLFLTPPGPGEIGLAPGLKTVAVGPSVRALFDAQASQRWRPDLGPAPFNDMIDEVNNFAAGIYESALTACNSADLVVSGFYLESVAACIAERYGVPTAFVHYAPYRHVPDSFFAETAPSDVPGLGPDPRITRALERMMFRLTRGDLHAFGQLRTQLGLAPTRLPTSRLAAELGILELQAFSAALVPGLADWSPRRPLTGFLGASADNNAGPQQDLLPADLNSWLDAGPPPVYVGFGSTPVLTPELLDNVTGAVGRTGGRVLAHAGWSTIDETTTDETYVLRLSVDLTALLPRCVAAIHHGGSGTTAISAAAGIPTLVCSLIGDQAFWGDQLVRRGVGAHLSISTVPRDDLDACVDYLHDPRVQQRAEVLAAAMAAESPGVLRAADLLERHAV